MRWFVKFHSPVRLCTLSQNRCYILNKYHNNPDGMLESFASLPILSVILRTIIIFCFAFLVIRFRGKRQLGQISLFDTIVIIALGSAVGDVMIYPEDIVSLDRSLIAMTTLVFLVFMIEFLVARSPKYIGGVVYGEETVIVYNGQLVAENFQKTMLTESQLLSRLREMGVNDYSELKSARLEPDGDISIQTFEEVNLEEEKNGNAA